MIETKKLFIALIGPPACGKTPSGLALEAEGYTRRVNSDLIKARMKQDPDFHGRADSIIANGGLLPDNMVISVVEPELDVLFRKGVTKIVFDGFPRTEGQGWWINGYLRRKNCRLHVVIIDTSEEDCRWRNAQREKEEAEKAEREGHQPRIDSSAQVHEGRLVHYRNQHPATEEFLRRCRGVSVSRIDGNKSKARVVSDVLHCVSNSFFQQMAS